MEIHASQLRTSTSDTASLGVFSSDPVDLFGGRNFEKHTFSLVNRFTCVVHVSFPALISLARRHVPTIDFAFLGVLAKKNTFRNNQYCVPFCGRKSAVRTCDPVTLFISYADQAAYFKPESLTGSVVFLNTSSVTTIVSPSGICTFPAVKYEGCPRFLSFCPKICCFSGAIFLWTG